MAFDMLDKCSQGQVQVPKAFSKAKQNLEFRLLKGMLLGLA